MLTKRTRMPEDLTGRTFNHLTVIESVRVGYGSWHWVCRCVCGKITKPLRAYRLKTSYTSSCGCKDKTRRYGSSSPRWKGHGDIAMSRWQSIIAGAKSRHKNFNVTIEEAWDLYEEQEGKCAISGVDIGFGTPASKRNGVPATASLDRKDSSRGYSLDNIQWIHKRVNIMKNSISDEDFVSWCKIIACYQSSNQSV